MRFFLGIDNHVACLLAVAVALPCPGWARGNREINDWQKSIVDIGRSITERDQNGAAWIVEYNSSFPTTEVGLVLAPSSYDRSASSLNIIAVCRPVGSPTITTDGYDFAEFAANRAVSFTAHASPPPSFLTGALSQSRAGLEIDRTRQVVFSLNDISVIQIAESDAIDTINTPDCVRRIRHRGEVFFVRGQYRMRLTMSQARTNNGAVDLSLSTPSAGFGFSVRWNRAHDWEINQTHSRPWFRIVSRFRRNRAGNGFDIVQ